MELLCAGQILLCNANGVYIWNWLQWCLRSIVTVITLPEDPCTSIRRLIVQYRDYIFDIITILNQGSELLKALHLCTDSCLDCMVNDDVQANQ